MHATSTQPMADHRTAAKAALAAIIFAAGVALGAVVGTTVAPLATQGSVNTPALDPDALGFRQYRDGEIGVGGATTDALRDQRHGEIGAGAGPAENALRHQGNGHVGVGGP